jgi:dipeptidyl-peptidase-4
MRRASLLLYLSLSAGATHPTAAATAPAPTPKADKGPLPGYLNLHAKTRGFSLGRPLKAVPTPDGRYVLFLRATASSPELRLYEFDVETGKTRELLTPAQLLQGSEEQLSHEEKARRERMRQSLRGFTSFEISTDGTFLLIPLSGKLYTVSRQSGAVTELVPQPEDKKDAAASREPAPAIDPQLSPDGKLVGYVRGRDLYVMELKTRRERRLTHSSDPLIAYGLAEFVAQEELHRFSGFFFSPDSQQIAYAEVDNRPVETLYLSDVLHPEVPPQPMRYPRAGTDNALVRLGVISVAGGATRWLEWPRDQFPYLATVSWHDTGPLLLTVLSRTQHDLQLLAADLKTGQTQPLLREHAEGWINVDQDMPRMLKDGSGFLWSSEQSGGRELELRDPKGALLRVLVPRAEGFRKLVDVDPDSGFVSYLASSEPTEQHLHRVPLLGGPSIQLTKEAGFHLAGFGKGHGVYVLQSFGLQSLARTQVMRIPANAVASGPDQAAGELPSVATPPPFVPKVEILQVGTQGYRVSVVRPRHFQPGKKYPVIVDVYGGPSHNQVMAVAGRYLLDQWLADHGYIVFSADGRGTPFRGTAWEQAISGSFGDIPLDDQVTALTETAKRLPELDLKRVGIFGWSFGGYMAALAVLRRPDVFQVGVAGAPVVDWHDYDTCYTERYLGLPSENQAGYATSSLLTYAPELRRPLLLIHGTSDDNVLFFHSLKLSHALFRAGKPHELLPLPGLTHMVPDPVVTEQMWTRIATVLSSALKPEFPPVPAASAPAPAPAKAH